MGKEIILMRHGRPNLATHFVFKTVFGQRDASDLNVGEAGRDLQLLGKPQRVRPFRRRLLLRGHVCATDIREKDWKAALAAATALSTSMVPPSATWPATISSAGLITSITVLPTGLTHEPSM